MAEKGQRNKRKDGEREKDDRKIYKMESVINSEKIKILIKRKKGILRDVND